VSQYRVLNSLAEFVARDVLSLPVGDDRAHGSEAFFHYLAAWRALSLLVVAALCVRVAWRARSTQQMAAGAAAYAMAFCALVATRFWPWYGTFAIALAAASAERRWLAPAVTLSLLSPVAIYSWKAFGGPGDSAALDLLYGARSLVFLLPPLAIGVALRRRRLAAG
jgi:hypothetical protein